MNDDSNSPRVRPLRLLWLGLLIVMLIVGFGSVVTSRGSETSDTYFFVVMTNQGSTEIFAEIPNVTHRKQAVYDFLTAYADRTQADLRSFLDQYDVIYTPFYLVNAIEVKGDDELRAVIAQRDDVARVIDSPRFNEPIDAWELLDDELMSFDAAPPQGIQPNIQAINAPQVWELGIRGQGIIVGGADTGVDWTHPAIRAQYAGGEGNHDYHWLDPFVHSEAPRDHNGHGTHTVGTMVGAYGIGVAPDAQWIGCMNMGNSYGNPASYITCMQFLFAPYPQNSDAFNGDPSRGAHIVNNSWGCPPVEGCDLKTLPIAAEHLDNAGQFYAVSAGNAGPGCSTIGNPAFSNDVVSVGAVTNAGGLASFSSRGPVLLENGTLVKPDITAPGVNVLSSMPGNTYRKASGTSMAAPHIAGVVALLWSAQPELIGEIDTTRQILLDSANQVQIESGRPVCGSAGVPNNLYGNGIVNVLVAVQIAAD